MVSIFNIRITNIFFCFFSGFDPFDRLNSDSNMDPLSVTSRVNRNRADVGLNFCRFPLLSLPKGQKLSAQLFVSDSISAVLYRYVLLYPR